MKPIDPTEISGFMDGELDPDREKEIRNAMTENESLRREYEKLISFDAEVNYLRLKAKAFMKADLD